MGLFDTFKAVGDIIKGGIESYKADSKLDDILAEVWTSYEDKLTSADKEAYLNYKMLQEKIEAQKSKDVSRVTNEMNEECDAAKLAYALQLAKNDSLPQELKNSLETAVETVKKVDAQTIERIKQRMLSACKTEEERQSMLKSFENKK